VETTKFELAVPGRIVFGPGSLDEAGAAAAALGSRALLVTGRDVGRAARLRELLGGAEVEAVPVIASGEPTVEMARAAAKRIRERDCDLVIGFGGGSALDLAKSAAVLARNRGDVLDYVEVIGRGKALKKPGLPWLAIPTTAGSGAEATRNAVLASPEHRVKVSLRSPGMLARVVIVDPELTEGLPQDVAGAGALDALTQLVEPLVCRKANPVVDGWCREGLRRSARAVVKIAPGGLDDAARTDLSLASLLSGLALGNAGLGAVHGIAGPFGGMFASAPHGAVCARLLPEVIEENLRALASRAKDSPALPRYAEVARILTDDEGAAPTAAAVWARELVEDLRIPRLSAYGLEPAEIPDLIDRARAASSMKANPVELTAAELRALVERAM
jgi:alcohol dehydrogenase class IV